MLPPTQVLITFLVFTTDNLNNVYRARYINNHKVELDRASDKTSNETVVDTQLAILARYEESEGLNRQTT